MTAHLGTVPSGSTVYIPFTTYGGTNGESVTMTGLAVTDVEIYKNGSVTQRASDNGYTLLDTDGIDFDGITGLHGFSVDLSDNSDSGFYAVGSWYWVVVSSVTVDSQTVTFLAATFRIGPAEVVTGYPVVDAGAISGDSTAADSLEAALDGTGGVTITAGLTGNVTGNLSGSVGSVTGAVGSVTGNVGGNVVGSVASVTGAVGSVTGNVGGIAGTITTLDALDTAQDSQHATTQGKVDTAQADLDILTGTDGATLATTQGNYAPAKAGDNMGTVSAVTGGINTGAGTITTLDALDTAQDSQHATTQAATTSILAKLLAYFRLLLRSDAGPTTDDATELTAINADGGSGAGNYDPTTDSAEAIADGGGGGLDAAGVRAAVGLASANLDTQLAALPTAAENADAVWEETIADHSGTAGSTAESLAAAGGAADPLLNSVPGSYGSGTAGEALGLIDDILSKTNLITTGTVVSIIAPTVGEDGKITIYQGDDYPAGELDITVPGTHDLTGASSVTFKTALGSKTMSVQSSGGATQTVRMTMTAAETAAYATGEYAYQIEAVLSGGSTKKIQFGKFIVLGEI